MNEWIMPAEPDLREWMSIFDYVCKRGAVGRENGIVFVIHTAEHGHNRPHLHAKYQDREVVLAIPSGEVIAGNIDAKKQKQASQWVAGHREYLMEKWDSLTNGVVCFG